MEKASTCDKASTMAGTGIDYLSILPHEIWVIILEMLCPKPGELISPEARIGLSEESFAPGVPPPSAEQSPEDILLNLVSDSSTNLFPI